MNTTISDAAVEVAHKVRVAYLNSAVQYGSMGVDERQIRAMRAALEATLPHLQQRPAEMAEPVVYQCPQCCTSMEVDQTAKPDAVRLRDELRERTPVGEQVSIPRYGLDHTELNRARISPDWRGEYVLFADHVAALAATGKQQVGDGIAETLEGVKAKLHPVEWSILMAGLSDARATEQVGEVQGDALRSFAREAVEYFRERSDVVDGDYGSPSPNQEMKLLSEGESALIAARQSVGRVPDGVWEALQRIIENSALHGPASNEDAILVARYRRDLLAAPSVPNGKLVAWWNGITPGYDGQGNYSIRWGADAENGAHDIPLYDGINPIHYQTPAQAVDMNILKLSRIIASYACSIEISAGMRAKCIRLQALIDGQAVQS